MENSSMFSGRGINYYLGVFCKIVGIMVVVWLCFVGLAAQLIFINLDSASRSMIMGEEDIMSDINMVEIVGRLGSDPNEHRTDSGFAIAGMSVATNRNWKDRNTGEWQKRVDWHQVSAFGKRAEWCISELKKGSRVRVMGRLQTDVVEDNYGKRKYYTKIVAHEIGLE